WGENAAGQLGDGTAEPRLGAVRATVIEGEVLSIAVDERDTCVLDTMGDVRCWGGVGERGSAPVLPPARVPLEEPAVQVSSRGGHSCAIGTSGGVWCWGYSLAAEDPIDARFDREPSRVADLDDAVTVSVGYTHACAATAAGTVRCWGLSNGANLGVERFGIQAGAREVSGLTEVLDVAVSAGTSCALLASGAVSCWGRTYSGELGDETTVARHTPAEVPGVAGGVAIAAGYSHFCVLLASGRVTCWGGWYEGRLTEIEGLADAIEISAGSGHTCALRSSGAIACWGERTGQRLGDGIPDAREGPVTALGIADAVQVTAGDHYTCALHESGRASCWGLNLFGEVGTSPADSSEVVAPLVVAGLSDAVELSAGSYDAESGEYGELGRHTCARISDGSVQCWGSNFNGELGEGAGDFRETPGTVAGIAGVAALSAGGAHTCALGTIGNVTCWGGDRGEQLGDASLARDRSFRAIDAGYEGTLAAVADGTVVSWGRIYMGLHHYDAWRSAAPVSMPGVSDVVGVMWPNCVFTRAGRVWCWEDYYDAFEDEMRPVPAEMPGFDDVVELRRGGPGLCARRGDGSVVCASWRDDRPTPVSGIVDAVSLAVGRNHACVAERTGEVLCWGSNRYGQLGDGAGGDRRETPVSVVGLP
ncbi:MAG: hypothetical protein IT379_32645, partial [Deltaproteobacteria bacterium]|nr:hypothetical protein [Deltaproteobacteria bacterium]